MSASCRLTFPFDWGNKTYPDEASLKNDLLQMLCEAHPGFRRAHCQFEAGCQYGTILLHMHREPEYWTPERLKAVLASKVMSWPCAVSVRYPDAQQVFDKLFTYEYCAKAFEGIVERQITE